MYQKYGAIFDWFDSLLVGLTATPKDEVDHNTYRLFHLEDGVPTDAYSLDEAVAEGYLVPAGRGVAVGTKFLRQGIRYDDLSEEEKDEWDASTGARTAVPTRSAPRSSTGSCSTTTPSTRCWPTLMTEGYKVAGGDRLGKTIIFAKNQDHAEFIEQRFNIDYPEYAGHFARVITHGIDLRPVPDRRLLDQGQGAAHRDLASTCSTPASTCPRSSTWSSSSWSGRRPSSGR